MFPSRFPTALYDLPVCRKLRGNKTGEIPALPPGSRNRGHPGDVLTGDSHYPSFWTSPDFLEKRIEVQPDDTHDGKGISPSSLASLEPEGNSTSNGATARA